MVVGVLFVFCAPTQLGGHLNYAVIEGSSMEPTLHHDDLAVLRARTTYNVGQVVGYRNSDLRRVVLHRIVGRQGERFVFKGDDNRFVDSVQPTRNQLIGGLWLRIPKLGGVLAWLRVPVRAMLVGVLAALLLAGSGVGTALARRRGRGPGGKGVPGAATARRRLKLPAESARAVLVAAAAGALVFGAVWALGAAHARTRNVMEANAYVQQAAFGYSGVAPAGAVYPSGRVRAGDTVFTRLVHRLRLTVDYRFSSALPHTVSGRGTFTAKIASQQGFSRALVLAPKASFSGDRWTATGTLDVDRLEHMIAAYQRATGVDADSYTIDVVPRIVLHGVIDGRSLRTTFTPSPLSLGLDLEKMKVIVPEQASEQVSAANPFQVRAAGAIARTEPATISLGRLHVSVPTVRRVGLFGALASALMTVLGLLLLVAEGRRDELTRIERRYASWVIPVVSPLIAPRVVDVADMDSLARLAEHYDRAILHEERNGAHTFAIEQDGTLYRLRLGFPERRLAAVATESPKVSLVQGS